jgi:hypothetical protein
VSVPLTDEQSAAVDAAQDLASRLVSADEWRKLYPQVDRATFLATGRRVNPDAGKVYGEETA